MSRYTIPAHTADLDVCVGWDSPMRTFFGQAFDTTLPREASCVLWVGEAVGEITTVAQLEALLSEVATLTNAERAQLQADYEARTTPTWLQQRMLDFFTTEGR